MIELPIAFINRMKSLLGADYGSYIKSLGDPPSKGLRINTLKVSVEEFLRIAPFEIKPTGMLDEGFLLKLGEGRAGVHAFHAAGLYYLQEPSAMSAIEALEPQPGMRILDLCAAPGGKAGGIAARMRGNGLLAANDPVPSRARVLRANLERLGVKNSVVTCARPEEYERRFGGWFDAALVDAPCSGEGMFRKDDRAVLEWSQEHVIACAARQSAVITSAAHCVRPGGVLVYATCTFSREENEDVVLRFLNERPDWKLDFMRRFYPHTSCGEGHFVARLKREGVRGEEKRAQEMKGRKLPINPCADETFLRAMADIFGRQPEGDAWRLEDGRVILLGSDLPEIFSGLHILSAGIEAGRLVKGRFEPAHALFMAVHGGIPLHTISLEADSRELRAFLSGYELNAPKGMKGYCAVEADGFTVGYGKAGSGKLKNHYPKGLRHNLSQA